MNRRKYLNNEEIELINEEYLKHTRKCKCGHSVAILNETGVAECSWCRNLVFKDKKTEFEYRMKQNLIRERRKNNEKYNSKEN